MKSEEQFEDGKMFNDSRGVCTLVNLGILRQDQDTDEPMKQILLSDLDKVGDGSRMLGAQCMFSIRRKNFIERPKK